MAHGDAVQGHVRMLVRSQLTHAFIGEGTQTQRRPLDAVRQYPRVFHLAKCAPRSSEPEVSLSSANAVSGRSRSSG